MPDTLIMRQLHILVAPSGFNDNLEAKQVAECIQEGIRRVFPEDSVLIHKAPLYDGGSNFSKALLSFYDAETRNLNINSPFYYSIPSSLGFIDGGKTAILDVAAAAGPQFIMESCPDPTRSTSYGIGELLVAALNAGCTKVIFDCGDSAAIDGGAGMLQAVGARLLDANNEDIMTIGGAPELSRLVTIDMDDIHPRLRKQEVCIEAVYETEKVLCGYDGVAFADGLVRRAPFEQVECLSLALDRFADVVDNILREDVGNKPGSGVSGGLGTGLMLLGAQFQSRHTAADEYFDLEALFKKQWDLVITGAGLFSSQFAKANMSRKVAKVARKHGVHAIAVVGTVGSERTADLYDEGVSSFMATSGAPGFLEGKADWLIKDAVERTMRMVQVGMTLSQNQTEPQALGIESGISDLDLE
ncbi:glycerate kinase [Hypoxylon sp. FL0890]|nr:glycerate kinase [Hypoxylon sp. FL0890]